MTRLHIGVNDVLEPNGTPTFDVAQRLEEKYSLFSTFANSEIQTIKNQLTQSAAGAVSNMFAGKMTKNPYREGCSNIVRDFQDFLDEEKIAGFGIPGVPTQAALLGKTTRKKSASAKGQKVRSVKIGDKFMPAYGPRRPSFIDSGILQANLQVWVDDTE